MVFFLFQGVGAQNMAFLTFGMGQGGSGKGEAVFETILEFTSNASFGSHANDA